VGGGAGEAGKEGGLMAALTIWFEKLCIDTSVWVAMFCFESKAATLETWLSKQSLQTVCCSDWLHTELMSAFSIKFRRGEMNLNTLASLQGVADKLRSSGATWIIPIEADFQLASQLCAEPTTKLRAGDTLHIAVAKRLQCKHFFF
jgi:uncharacterized protein